MRLDALKPAVENYNIWSKNPSGSEESDDLSQFSTRGLDQNDVEEIESVRPGYGASALRYFKDGHHGVGIFEKGKIIAFGWYYVNESDTKTCKVKGYHPLYPKHVLLHAAWVHPESRGRGLHHWLVTSRLKALSHESSVREIEAAIRPTNKRSEKSYSRAGFVVKRKLTVITWLGFSIGRYHHEQ